MDEIPNNIKRTIIEARISQWKNTQYQSIIDLRIAEKIEDVLMGDTAKEGIKRCEIALDVFLLFYSLDVIVTPLN